MSISSHTEQVLLSSTWGRSALNGHRLQPHTLLWPERNQPQLESCRVVLVSHCSAAGKFSWEEASISRGIIYGFRPKMNCILLARSFDDVNIELTIPAAADQNYANWVLTTSKYLPTTLQAPPSPYTMGTIPSTLVSPITGRWKMTVTTQEAWNCSRNWTHITAEVPLMPWHKVTLSYQNGKPVFLGAVFLQPAWVGLYTKTR